MGSTEEKISFFKAPSYGGAFYYLLLPWTDGIKASCYYSDNMADMADKVTNELLSLADKERAKNLAWFFKTGKGDYGEGDNFLGITVPLQRRVAEKHYREISLEDIERLLDSIFHEVRLTAALMLVGKYLKADNLGRKEIYDFYVSHTAGINNWDIVDASAHKIMGDWLKDKSRKPLYRMARSKNLWERRIAIISTFAFIAEGDLDDSFKLAETLLKDRHDLMHKAVGWVLRECGKKDKARLIEFIKENGTKMPRTALRYAIEKFSERERKKILKETAKAGTYKK